MRLTRMSDLSETDQNSILQYKLKGGSIQRWVNNPAFDAGGYWFVVGSEHQLKPNGIYRVAPMEPKGYIGEIFNTKTLEAALAEKLLD